MNVVHLFINLRSAWMPTEVNGNKKIGCINSCFSRAWMNSSCSFICNCIGAEYMLVSILRHVRYMTLPRCYPEWDYHS